MNTDMQGDVLAVHRGDRNRDDILGYPKKTDVEGFRDGDDDGWRTLSRDEQNTFDMVKEGRLLKDEQLNTSCEERVSISREEVGTPRSERQVMEVRDDEGSPVTSERVGENESIKWYEPLERVDRDDEQAVLERDEKVLGFVSRDIEESGSGSTERDGNTLSREIKKRDTEVANGQAKADDGVGGTEEDTAACNRCEHRDEIRVLEKDDEDNSSLMLREKDDEPQSLRCETQVNETSLRKMEMREVTGEQDSSPCTADAVKGAGETYQNVYFNGPVLPQSPTQGHRRTQSEIGTPGHRRTNSFQRLKTQMQKAWRGVSNLREDNRPTFNPEVLANQKRQWYQLHSSKALVFNLSRVSYQSSETRFWLCSSSP